MHDTLAVFIEYGPQFLDGLAETIWLTLLGALCALAAAVVLQAAAASPGGRYAHWSGSIPS